MIASHQFSFLRHWEVIEAIRRLWGNHFIFLFSESILIENLIEDLVGKELDLIKDLIVEMVRTELDMNKEMTN